jgi:hypothetical protein
VYHAVLQIHRALGEHALGRALDVRREHAVFMGLVQLRIAKIIIIFIPVEHRTHDDERPFVRRVERDLEHLREGLLVLVVA